MNKLTKITTALAHTIAERKEIETKEKALKLELKDLLTKEGRDKEETEYGVFTIAHRPKWEYPEHIADEIDALKADIADIEEQAQHNGDAIQHFSEYILFKETE